VGTQRSHRSVTKLSRRFSVFSFSVLLGNIFQTASDPVELIYTLRSLGVGGKNVRPESASFFRFREVAFASILSTNSEA
jgi:hypothetical protein